jgi:hypothetical protein
MAYQKRRQRYINLGFTLTKYKTEYHWSTCKCSKKTLATRAEIGKHRNHIRKNIKKDAKKYCIFC